MIAKLDEVLENRLEVPARPAPGWEELNAKIWGM